jgi:integrase
MAHNPRLYKNIATHGPDVILERRTGSVITENDAKLLRKFITEMRSSASEMRATHITSVLVNWRRFIDKEYSEWTIDDIHEGIAAMKNGISLTGKPFTQNSIRDYMKDLKQFLKWMNRKKILTIPTEELESIKPPKADEDTTRPEDLPTYDETLQIIKSGKTPRQRAFMAVLYESGCRIGELCRMTWRDALFEQKGGVDTISLTIDDEKTKQKRHARLILAAPFLIAYKVNLGAIDPRDFIFKAQDGQPMSYAGAYLFFMRIVKKSGVPKRLTPHDMRRARATHLAQQRYQPQQAMLSLWGNVNTRQARRYFKLDDKDIDAEFLRAAGITVEDNVTAEVNLPIKCLECGTINSPGQDTCKKCGAPISREAVKKAKAAEQEQAEANKKISGLTMEQLKQIAMIINGTSGLDHNKIREEVKEEVKNIKAAEAQTTKEAGGQE